MFKLNIKQELNFSSVKEFNTWRKKNPDIKIDLSGQDLSGLNLQGINLKNAILIGTNFKGANLEGASIIGASLSGTNFTGAKTRGCSANFSPGEYKQAEQFIKGLLL